MKVIFKYTFHDGTVLRLLNIGLTTEEIWKLQELHGECEVEVEVESK